MNQEIETEEHEAPAAGEAMDAEEKDGSEAAAGAQVEEAADTQVVDTVTVSQIVTEVTTVVTETVREEADFDLNVGEEAEREDEIAVPEQNDQRDEIDAELIQRSRSVMLPDDQPVEGDAEDAQDAQGESGNYQEEVDEAMPTSATDEAAENGEDDVGSEDGEPLSEEESEEEDVEEVEAEEDVGEVEDEDDTREDEADDEGIPSIRSKIWDFLTT